MPIIKQNDILKETLYVKTLSSNIKTYIIPKKNYSEKQAIITVNFGSVNEKFKVNDMLTTVPDGTAHFLEHKMFAAKGINIFEQFHKNGANVNAFTNFTNTAYYFNCLNNFNENVKILLDFIFNPYFTDENIEKEKDIIEQEIKMYDDNPFWRVYLNLLNSMYHTCPIKKNIAGSLTSIKNIDRQLLYKCYENYYVPGNMGVVLAGDFETDSIYDIIENNVVQNKNGIYEDIFQVEPNNVVKNYAEDIMSLSKPIFYIGFKDNCTNSLASTVCSKILLDILVGESSQFYEKIYSKGLIDGPFGLDYIGDILFGHAILTGYSDNPKKVYELLLEEIALLKLNGINENRFRQIKHKHIGEYIRNFNSIDSISLIQASLFQKKTDIIDLMDVYINVSIDKICDRISFLTEENSVLSVIMPR